VHTLTYPNAVVSMAVASGDQAVVAGMVDGLVSIRRMIVDSKPSHLKKIRADRERKMYKEPKRPNDTQKADKIIKDRVKGPGLKKFDVHLRRFDHKKALDDVMAPQMMEKQPELVVAVVTDLLHRRCLYKALIGRPDRVLVRFINFVINHLGEMRFMRPLLMAASTILMVFERRLVTYSQKLMEALERLAFAMETEVKLTTELMQLKGAMDMLIGVSMDNGEVVHKSTYVDTKGQKMQPSSAAEKYVVMVE